MKKLLILSGFVLGNFSILLIAFLFLTIYTTKNTVAVTPAPLEVLQAPDNSNAYADMPVIPAQTATITARDARVDILETFFKNYGHPMIGLGKDVVTAADKYQIPYGIVPAIGACEGGLGQKIPDNSFNTWGWGIYGGKVARFGSWQEAIDTVSKGLSSSYFQNGLDTPEKIMPKYAPSSTGTWSVCVNKYWDDLR